MARGYNAAADVVKQLADGTPLDDVWNEYQATINIQNAQRQKLIDLLTFSVTNPVETVPQGGAGSDFEEASEYGVPQSTRPTSGVFQLGFSFKWYDIATRFTWRFLAEASRAQVDAVHASVLEADNRLIFRDVMRTLFRNNNRTADINGQNYTVYSFYNGDGTVPPPYKNNTFNGTYTHFRSTGAATVDSGDLDEIITSFSKLGYGAENGTQLFVMVNEAQAAAIRLFRAGQTNANTAVATYDFIPSQGQSLLMVSQNGQPTLVGSQVSNTFRGMNVIGAYGPLLIIEESYVPAGYMVALASGGPGNIANPIGFREHAQPALRGLKLLPGKDTYPLIDSYYIRGFGTGVRQRGAGMVMKVSAGAYTIPTEYA